MPAPILATKLYLPPPRPGMVPRPRLVERLNEGLAAGRKLALISAPAGFGKTTLVSEWIATLTPSPSPTGRGEWKRVAWFSLDEGDNDPARFITYLVAALQTIEANIGADCRGAPLRGHGAQKRQCRHHSGIIINRKAEVAAL